ncbi:hypothetical protein L0156_28075 [bacterium]|nr:hypothetical protein [bacterium]
MKAIAELGRLKSPRKFQPLLKAALEDEAKEVRQAAVDFFCESDDWTGSWLQQFKSSILKVLQKSHDSDDKIFAAKICGLTANQEAVSALTLLLADYSLEVRKQAEQSLQAISPAWPELKAARSALPRLICRLPELHSPADQRKLTKYLHNIDPLWTQAPEARSTADKLISSITQFSFKQTPDGKAEPILSALTILIPDWENTPEARSMVGGLLHILGNSEGIAAQNALDKIDPTWRESDVCKEFTTYLLFEFQNLFIIGDLPDVLSAAIALGRIRARDAISLMSRALDRKLPSNFRTVIETSLDQIDQNWPLSAEAAESVSRLILQKPNASALGRLTKADFTSLLEKLLYDPSSKIRITAVTELESRGWKPKDDFHNALLALIKEDWKTIAALEERIIDPVVTLLKIHRDEQSRYEREKYVSYVVEKLLKTVSSRVFGLLAAKDLSMIVTYVLEHWRHGSEINPRLRNPDVILALAPELAQRLNVKLERITPAAEHGETSWEEGFLMTVGLLGDARCISPLIQVAKDNEDLAEDVILALSELLNRNQRDATVESLEAAARLDDVYQTVWEYNKVHDLVLTSGKRRVDVSNVNRIASTELEDRRGKNNFGGS